MRVLLAALCLAALNLAAAATAARAAPLLDGPVTGGAFGMGGSDYYGDVHDRSPFAAGPGAATPARRRAHRAARAPGRRGAATAHRR